MVTELQQKIIDEINKFSSLEIAKENADKIAEESECSPAYVKKMIKRQSDGSSSVQIKVAPPKPEPEEEDEPEESDGSFDVPEDDWEFDEDEEEPELESDEEEPKPADMPLEQILSKENVEMIISVPFRMAADFTGWDGAELTADEKKRLTPMARQIMLKYLPDLMATYFVEIVFILIVGEVVVSKYRAYNEFASEQESKKKAQEDATKQAEIEEKRRLEQEEAARKAPETPEPEEEPRPRSKEEAGDPSWNQPGGLGG